MISLRGQTSPPYKYKGPRPIEEKISIKSIKFYLLSYLPFRSSLPYFSNPTMLFFLHLHYVWRRPSWPTEPRTNLRAPPRRNPARATFFGLSPDLPGDIGLTGDSYRSDRYSVEALQGSPLRACWPRKGANRYVPYETIRKFTLFS
jgi:hypothetical protein